MFVLKKHHLSLLQNLENRGMIPQAIPGFYWSLKSCLDTHPAMSVAEINQLLKTRGFDDIRIDADTLNLAKTCFKDDGID